jgi:aryl-alcohol dehydrogenase-like predicted oxidoreductase
MSLTNYRTLGQSGLVVSPIGLGTMTFGNSAWGANEAVSREILNSYRNQGGNFIDTADVYSGGVSEEIVGRFIASTSTRDEFVLATKFGFNGASSPLEESHSVGNPNASGAGAKNIYRALHSSLKRLQTDYVDLYWMHIWDGVTPVEEILQTLGDLVRAGKIRYFGFSDMPAWVATKAATLARERRVPAPIAMQVEYSLVARDIDREHLPAARDGGMAVVPWSPLAGGFLSGKYSRTQIAGAGRLGGPNPFGNSKFTERNWAILEELCAVAAEQGRTPAQIALAWALSRPGVSSVIIGASKMAQLDDNLGALSVVLTDEQLRRLNEISAIVPGFSDTLTAPWIRRMIFGGHDVRGWGE